MCVGASSSATAAAPPSRVQKNIPRLNFFFFRAERSCFSRAGGSYILGHASYYHPFRSSRRRRPQWPPLGGSNGGHGRPGRSRSRLHHRPTPGGERQSSGQAGATARARDPLSVHQGARDLHLAADPTRARSSHQGGRALSSSSSSKPGCPLIMAGAMS